MHEALLVRVVQAFGGLDHTRDRLGHRKRAMLFDQGDQICPWNVFHGEVQPTVGFICVKSGDDIGMAEFRSGLNLSLKSP